MTFPLVGNERLRKTVGQMLESGRFPHALLIEGEAGTGRHTLANYLAAAAVCDGAEKPCGVCKNCHLAAARTHPDIALYAPEDGKKNISVMQARELRSSAWIRPHMALRRVFLIDRAETLNEQAQNALLKILEEPPDGVLFLLIITSKAQLLETVVSRCAVLSVSIPSTEAALGFLRQHSKKETAELERALNASGNRIGRALALLGKRTESKIDRAAAEFIRLLPTGDAYALLKVLQPFEKDRAATETLFSALREEATAQLRENLQNRMEMKRLTALFEQTERAAELLKTNINLSLLFSALVCRVVEI